MRLLGIAVLSGALRAGSCACALHFDTCRWLAFRSKKNLALPGYILLGTGVEPARAINAGDFKSPVSTIPPSEQE